MPGTDILAGEVHSGLLESVDRSCGEAFNVGGGRVAGIPGCNGESARRHSAEIIQREKDYIRGRIHEMASNVGDALYSVGTTLWDAYMRGYNLQQNSRMQEAQLMLDGTTKICTFLDEIKIIDVAKNGWHSVQTANEAKSVGLLGCTNTYSNRRVPRCLSCNKSAISFVSSCTGGIAMKPNRGVKYSIGALIVDGLLILETANDVRTGKLTWMEFCIIIMVCMIITFLLAAIFRRSRRKYKNQFKPPKEDPDCTDN